MSVQYSLRTLKPTPKTMSAWRLRPSPKYASFGVVRTVPPEETIRRVTPLMPVIGVTRVADVTRLDRVGIPNYVAVRPRDVGDGITYYNGKGTTRIAAKAGAMMEAIERYSGERCDLEVFRGTYKAVRRRGPALDPEELIAPRFREYTDATRLEWVEGFDLNSQRPTYVPLNSVVQPYESADFPPLYYASTNGLASGNTIEEALCHALCEVIERDTESISSTILDLAPAVTSMLSRIGAESASRPEGEDTRSPLIDPASLPPKAKQLARKMRAAGLRVYLRDITHTGGVPTLECTVVEDQLDGRHLAHGGCGTHPDARVALMRALTEAAQSRVGCIQGGREDLPEIMKRRVSFNPDAVFGAGVVRPFSSIRTFEHGRVDEDVRFLLGRLKAAGLDRVVAVDLTRPELGVPVVKVVVPKAESWSIFQSHVDRGMFGPRVTRILGELRFSGPALKP